MSIPICHVIKTAAIVEFNQSLKQTDGLLCTVPLVRDAHSSFTIHNIA